MKKINLVCLLGLINLFQPVKLAVEAPAPQVFADFFKQSDTIFQVWGCNSQKLKITNEETLLSLNFVKSVEYGLFKTDFLMKLCEWKFGKMVVKGRPALDETKKHWAQAKIVLSQKIFSVLQDQFLVKKSNPGFNEKTVTKIIWDYMPGDLKVELQRKENRDYLQILSQTNCYEQLFIHDYLGLMAGWFGKEPEDLAVKNIQNFLIANLNHVIQFPPKMAKQKNILIELLKKRIEKWQDILELKKQYIEPTVVPVDPEALDRIKARLKDKIGADGINLYTQLNSKDSQDYLASFIGFNAFKTKVLGGELAEFKASNDLCNFLAAQSNWEDFKKFLVTPDKFKLPENAIRDEVAQRWVRNAAARVFNRPLRSFLELVVNACDAVTPQKTVGKFGMGFLSILQLLGNPEMPGVTIRIQTCYSGKLEDEASLAEFIKNKKVPEEEIAYEMAISLADPKNFDVKIDFRELDGGDDLFAKLNERYPGEPHATGTLITIISGDKKFTPEDLAELRSYTHYLDFYMPVRTVLSTQGNPEERIGGTGESPKNFVNLSPDKLEVLDNGTGISLFVAMFKLFIPSSSTKVNPKLKERRESLRNIKIDGSEVISATFDQFKGKKRDDKAPHFLITVNGVLVIDVDLPQQIKEGDQVKDVLVQMPDVTQLTLARDELMIGYDKDKSLEELFLYKIIEKTIATCLKPGEQPELLQAFFDGLKSWESRSSNLYIKDRFTSYFKNKLAEKLTGSVISVPIEFAKNKTAIGFLHGLVPVGLGPELADYNYTVLENMLGKLMPSSNDPIKKDAKNQRLVAGKQVFFVKTGDGKLIKDNTASDLGLKNTLFVPEEWLSQAKDEAAKNVFITQELPKKFKEVLINKIKHALPSQAIYPYDIAGEHVIITNAEFKSVLAEVREIFLNNVFPIKDKNIIDNTFYDIKGSIDLNLFQDNDERKQFIEKVQFFKKWVMQKYTQLQDSNNENLENLIKFLVDYKNLCKKPDFKRDLFDAGCTLKGVYQNATKIPQNEDILKEFDLKDENLKWILENDLKRVFLNLSPMPGKKQALYDYIELTGVKDFFAYFNPAWKGFDTQNQPLSDALVEEFYTFTYRSLYYKYDYSQKIEERYQSLLKDFKFLIWLYLKSFGFGEKISLNDFKKQNKFIYIGSKPIWPLAEDNYNIENYFYLFVNLLLIVFVCEDYSGWRELAYREYWQTLDSCFVGYEENKYRKFIRDQYDDVMSWLKFESDFNAWVPIKPREIFFYSDPGLQNIDPEFIEFLRTRISKFRALDNALSKSFYDLSATANVMQVTKFLSGPVKELYKGKEKEVKGFGEKFVGVIQEYFDISPNMISHLQEKEKIRVVDAARGQDLAKISGSIVNIMTELKKEQGYDSSLILEMISEDFIAKCNKDYQRVDLENKVLRVPSIFFNSPLFVLTELYNKLEDKAYAVKVISALLKNSRNFKELMFAANVLLAPSNFELIRKNAEKPDAIVNFVVALCSKFIPEKVDKSVIDAAYDACRVTKLQRGISQYFEKISVTKSVGEWLDALLSPQPQKSKSAINNELFEEKFDYYTLNDPEIKEANSLNFEPRLTLKKLINAHVAGAGILDLLTKDLLAEAKIKIRRASAKFDLGKITQSVEFGSERAPIHATLIECFQNSVDAINSLARDFKQDPTLLSNKARLKAFGDNQEEVYKQLGYIDYKIETLEEGDKKHLCLSIIDHVGFPSLKQLLTDFMLPDYSTKSPELGNVGDMGNGTFKIYQHASMVFLLTRTTLNPEKFYLLIIKPHRNDTTKLIDDLNLDCLDVSTWMGVHNSKFFGTSFKIIFEGKSGAYTVLDVVDTRNFLLECLSATTAKFADNKQIILRYGENELNSKPNQLFYSSNGFTFSRRKDEYAQSYLLTNGVPFKPLAAVLEEEKLCPPEFIPAMRNGFVLDLALGTFQPVQSRTRLMITEANKNKLMETVKVAHEKNVQEKK